MARHDLRVKRTQKYLKMAFISLLQEKAFHKVSVQALTQRAEINRVTFYLHYQDMDDFVEQFVQGLLEEIKGILQAAEKEMEMHDAMHDDVLTASWVEMIIRHSVNPGTLTECCRGQHPEGGT